MYAEIPLIDKAKKFIRLMLGVYAFPPNDITIELSTRCNEKCGVCFREPLRIKDDVMSLDVFKIVFERLCEACGTRGVARVTLVGMGEVFCNKDLVPILRHIKSRSPGTMVQMSSNLSSSCVAALEAIVCERLVDLVSVSIDDVLPLDNGLHPWKAAVENNLLFLRHKSAEYYPGLRIRVQSLISSKQQIARVIDFASCHGVGLLQLMRIDLHAWAPRSAFERLPWKEEINIVRFAKQYASKRIMIRYNNAYNLFMKVVSRKDRLCLLTDDHVFVDVGGNVLPCFYLRDYKLGSLLKEPLEKIYQHETKQSFYRCQQRLCAGCDVYKNKHHH